MRTSTINILTAGPQAMTGNITSDAIYIGQSMGCCIQAVFTGSPVGSFKLQISQDQGPNETIISATQAPVVNWSDYTGSATNINGGGNFSWDVTITNSRWIRLVYTFTSGTGTLQSVQCNVKG